MANSSLQEFGHKGEQRNGVVPRGQSGDKKGFLKIGEIICLYVVETVR